MACSTGSSSDWYCIRSQPKHEHIAAAHLQRCLQDEVEVFNPRLRIRRRTRRGAVWFIEALFPGYLFAKFDPSSSIQAVRSTPGVSTIVSFGLSTPSIPEEMILNLRNDFGDTQIHEMGDDINPGDEITIAAGPFRGFTASVVCLLPAPERVRVLLDMLGRSTAVELDRQDILTSRTIPERLLSSIGTGRD